MLAGKARWWPVDHCHETGAVRDILCYSCNTGLGLFADNPGTFIAAAEYVTRHKSAGVTDTA